MINIIGEGVRFFDKVRVMHGDYIEYDWREVSGSDIDKGVFPRVLQVYSEDGLHRLRYKTEDWTRNVFLNVDELGMFIYDGFTHSYMSQGYYINGATRWSVYRDELREQLRP